MPVLMNASDICVRSGEDVLRQYVVELVQPSLFRVQGCGPEDEAHLADTQLFPACNRAEIGRTNDGDPYMSLYIEITESDQLMRAGILGNCCSKLQEERIEDGVEACRQRVHSLYDGEQIRFALVRLANMTMLFEAADGACHSRPVLNTALHDALWRQLQTMPEFAPATAVETDQNAEARPGTDTANASRNAPTLSQSVLRLS